MKIDKHGWMGRLMCSLLLAPCSLLLVSCNLLPQQQTDPVRHFTLSGPAGAPAVADAVRVRPVQLAGHLRNRSVAVRVSVEMTFSLK